VPSDAAVEEALEALEAADIDQRFSLTRKASYSIYCTARATRRRTSRL